MKKLLQSTAIVIMGIIAVVFIGAGCMQELATPAYINESAAEWAGVPTKLFMPYTTLWDAKRVGYAIDYKLTIEKIKGGYYKNITDLSILAGNELKNTLFKPDGLISLLMIGGPFLYAGGKFIPRGKDKKIIEALKNGKS